MQEYLPIKDLRNGIIETTDNRYIKILEIEPINFTLRSDEEQFNIISSFASWLKISPMCIMKRTEAYENGDHRTIQIRKGQQDTV